MLVELEFVLKIDGDESYTFQYKLEDGKDEDFMDLCQEARCKLCEKMKICIKESCQ